VKGAWNALGGSGPTVSDLLGLGGTSPENVWAVGYSGAVFRRQQAVWSREATGVVQGDLYAVAAADGGEVFAVGDTAGDMVLVGQPGRWVLEPQGTASTLNAVMADDLRAIAVGGGGAWVERRRGPGGVWTPATSGTAETLYGVAGRVQNGRATEVNAVGTNCTLVTQTSDAGFSVGQVPGCSGGDVLRSVWQGADGELLVGGDNGFVARRLNGTWSREYLGTTLEHVYAVAKSGSRSWASCENGEIYVRVNGTWQQELPRFSNVGFKAMWANPLGDVWIAGTGGSILRGR
jgi:hypothetical protein